MEAEVPAVTLDTEEPALAQTEPHVTRDEVPVVTPDTEEPATAPAEPVQPVETVGPEVAQNPEDPDQLMLNTKGKRTLRCEKCHGYYEARDG